MASSILISKNGEYFIEDYPVKKMIERCGSPFYVYSKEKLLTNFNSFKSIGLRTLGWVVFIPRNWVKSALGGNIILLFLL